MWKNISKKRPRLSKKRPLKPLLKKLLPMTLLPMTLLKMHLLRILLTNLPKIVPPKAAKRKRIRNVNQSLPSATFLSPGCSL